VAQLDHPSGEWVFGGEPDQGLVKGKEIVLGRQNGHIGEIDAPQRPTALEARFTPNTLDENPPHRLGGRALRLDRLR